MVSFTCLGGWGGGIILRFSKFLTKYKESNFKLIYEWGIVNDLEGSSLNLIDTLLLVGTEEIHKNLNHNNLCPCRGSNRPPLAYKSEALPLERTYSVSLCSLVGYFTRSLSRTHRVGWQNDCWWIGKNLEGNDRNRIEVQCSSILCEFETMRHL
jgi:hypothetical protein